jgi:hypothetical protein
LRKKKKGYFVCAFSADDSSWQKEQRQGLLPREKKPYFNWNFMEASSSLQLLLKWVGQGRGHSFTFSSSHLAHKGITQIDLFKLKNLFKNGPNALSSFPPYFYAFPHCTYKFSQRRRFANIRPFPSLLAILENHPPSMECGENEEYREGCMDRICFKPRQVNRCVRRFTGCHCQDGFVREGPKCVKPGECWNNQQQIK